MVFVELEDDLFSVGTARSSQILTSAAGTFLINAIEPSSEASNEDLKEMLKEILHPKKDTGDMWDR